MRIFFPALISLLLIISCKQKNTDPGGKITLSEIRSPADSLLLSDSTWGGITALTDFDELKQLYSESNIKDERICGPECVDSFDVTRIYPGSNREFIVYWQDSLYHKQIGFIRCLSADAPYYTEAGVKIGTTLNELLRINGKPIAFFGFGWDYGGGIISLNHGVLEKTNVRFNLALAEQNDDNSVYGDTELNSDMPAVKKLLDKIYVSELFLPFNKQASK
ncbi:MAG TPA: hypothetical protein VN451_09750 [Chitinophagaceae bacterium]|nr:hypothetical protein [Chitinophagaceae bacterium]